MDSPGNIERQGNEQTHSGDGRTRTDSDPRTGPPDSGAHGTRGPFSGGARPRKFTTDGVAAYDAWFDQHRSLYLTLLASAGLLSNREGRSLEVGVSTGRFAGPLGIEIGVDSCPRMLEIARSRGVRVHRGVTEHLPFPGGTFGGALLVQEPGRGNDPARALGELRRVLVDGGQLLVVLQNPETPTGDELRTAGRGPGGLWGSLRGVRGLVRRAGFGNLSFYQTGFGPLDEIDRVQKPREGTQNGAFLVLEAR